MSGFSLLEVLVAFVVLSLVLGVVMRIYAQGLEGVGESDFQARAVLLAESRLALVGADIPLEEGETAGRSEDGLAWRLRLSAYDPDREQGQGGSWAVSELPPVRLLRLDVWVNEPGQDGRDLHLATLRLAPRRGP